MTSCEPATIKTSRAAFRRVVIAAPPLRQRAERTSLQPQPEDRVVSDVPPIGEARGQRRGLLLEEVLLADSHTSEWQLADGGRDVAVLDVAPVVRAGVAGALRARIDDRLNRPQRLRNGPALIPEEGRIGAERDGA